MQVGCCKCNMSGLGDYYLPNPTVSDLRGNARQTIIFGALLATAASAGVYFLIKRR